jgi:hypothetical protein
VFPTTGWQQALVALEATAAENYCETIFLIKVPAMPRANRPVTITLGDPEQREEARLKSDAYACASEIRRATLSAVVSEEVVLDDRLR